MLIDDNHTDVVVLTSYVFQLISAEVVRISMIHVSNRAAASNDLLRELALCSFPHSAVIQAGSNKGNKGKQAEQEQRQVSLSLSLSLYPLHLHKNHISSKP